MCGRGIGASRHVTAGGAAGCLPCRPGDRLHPIGVAVTPLLPVISSTQFVPTIDHLLNLIGPLIPWLIGFSVIMLLISVIAVPWVAVAIPADYFTHSRRRRLHRRDNGSPKVWIWLIVKNLLGGILVILGLIMLVAPGQGVLTILIGLGIADFPGKYRLERRLVSLPGILRSLNWIRQRRGRPPLETPPQTTLRRKRCNTFGSKDGR